MRHRGTGGRRGAGRGLPLRLLGAGDGKAVCFHPVTEGTGTTRQPAFMGLCPKPRSLSNRGEWLQGKRPLPGARFPSWEPIAPSGLLGLLSSRALSVPAVGRTRNIRRKDARAIGESLKESTFAQFNSVHFCSARHSRSATSRSSRNRDGLREGVQPGGGPEGRTRDEE